jgi:hypothetical protein
MKKHINWLIAGIVLGLIMGTVIWYREYFRLVQNYSRSIELLRFYKNYVENH